MLKNNILLALVLLFFQVMVMGQGVNCTDSEPFCTGPPYTYPAGTTGYAEPGPYYGCLSSRPAPAWFYMLVEDAGPVEIMLCSEPPMVDIDFICWGPFTNPVTPCVEGLTEYTVVDCSFSTNPCELCNIQNGQTGQYYIMMITNYSEEPADITFTQTAGSGSLACILIADFSASPLEGPAPLYVQFTDESVGTPTSYKWDFQNDGIYDIFSPNPSYTYMQPGVYSVKLRVQNPTEVDSTIKVNYITVLAPDIDVVPSSLTIIQNSLIQYPDNAVPAPRDILTINNIGTYVLTVSSISSSDPWILTSGFPDTIFNLYPGESQPVTVDIDWQQLGGDTLTGNIFIASSDPDEPIVNVTVTAVPLGMPDLVIQNQNIDSVFVEPGGSVTASCDVTNQGNGDAGMSYLKFYLSSDSTYDNGDLELGSDTTDNLDAGQSGNIRATLLIPSNTNAGAWYILFFADADDQILESDENNNLGFVDFMVVTGTGIPVFGSNANASSIKVYPNPSRDRLYIDLSGMKDTPVGIEIYNSSGALMHLSKHALVSPGMMSVNCVEWPAGSYVVRIKLTKDIIETWVVKID